MTFEKGKSGNPGGKRKEKLFTDALRTELMHAHDEDYKIPQGATNLQVVARKLVEAGASGNAMAIKEIADRIEGKSDANVSVEHSGSVTHEHEGVPATLGWLGEVRGTSQTGETQKPVLN